MKDERGVTVLELLIVVVIVCVIAAIGIPKLHRGADSAFLETNLRTLGNRIVEQLAEGYSPAYRASGEGDPGIYLSTALEEELMGANDAVYVNPFVGRDKGTAVVNSHTVTLRPGFVAPAVLITDAYDCRSTVFSDLSADIRLMLAGALVVAFDPVTSVVDVYYVDQLGQASRLAVSVPMAVAGTALYSN